MEAFQREMNENRDEGRRVKWRNHRAQVTGLFHDVFSKKSSVDKIAIFGAGNCDDLDLDDLALNCNTIYLFDLDVESMKRGIQNFSASTRNQIELIELDVTGLNKIDFEQKLTSLLESGEKAEKIVQYLIATMNHLVGISENKAWLESFDIVAISAIYTQLFYNWALDTLSEYNEKYNQNDLDKIKEGFLDLRDQIVLTFQDSVSKFCHPNGFFISWSDMLKMENEYMEVIQKGPNAIFSLASNVGYGAALIGIKDFIEKVDKEDFSLRFWPWDFNKERQYLTVGLLGRISGNH